MKKLVVLIIFLGLLASGKVLAQEKVNDFGVEIKINQDASINVSEKIYYDFGVENRHGIYRDIPIKYQRDGHNYNLDISDILVVNDFSNPYIFTTRKSGDYLNIKIGDPNKTITGENIYIINYTVKWAINYFDEHDELYWNVTGNKWDVFIKEASATVFLPEPIELNNLQKTCFKGFLNSQEECNNILIDTENGLATSIFYEDGALKAGEGLTIVTGFPKGGVYQPTKTEYFLKTLTENLHYIFIILLPLIVFIILFRRWRLHGKDVVGRGTIIPQYDAPDNLTPAEVGTIIDEKADNRDISADIINLAVRGYLKIKKIETAKDDYLLTKLKSKDDLTNGFEKKLLTSLFGDNNEIKLSDLKNKFFKDLNNIRKEIYQATTEKGYFVKNPQTVRTTYIVIGVAVMIAGPFLGIILGPLGIPSFILSGILFIIFSFLMPKRTKKGTLAKEHILGLKTYLTVAEKDRYKFHYAPKKDPKVFEKLLPFAIALKVEKEWAKQFEGIYNTQPDWYSDPSKRVFSSIILANSLSNFNSSANSVLASTPHSSAGGGGSGFGGGGFSGGGFGGGGGGSW